MAANESANGVLTADEWRALLDLADAERARTGAGWTLQAGGDRIGVVTWWPSLNEQTVRIAGWTEDERREQEEARREAERRKAREAERKASEYPPWPDDDNRYLRIARDEAERHGIRILRWRTGLSGAADIKKREIEAPQPRGRKSLFIFLHEVGHVVLRHEYGGNGKRRYVVEYEAERWAIARMRELGVPVHRDSVKRAKGYVARKIGRAYARGLKAVNPEVERWVNGR